jgi:hypothetical protein
LKRKLDDDDISFGALLGIDNRDATGKETETQRRWIDKWREKLSGNSLTTIAVAESDLLRYSSPRV